MKVLKAILIILFLTCLRGYSQTDQNQFRVWRLVGFNGDIRARGTFREFEVERMNYSLSKQQDYYFNGLLHLNTKSYILHPNFMLLSLSGTYNPISRKDMYIGMPESTESYRTQGFEASTVMFSKKRINLTASAVMNNSLQNIENITRMETKNKQFGAGLTYRNRVFPISVAVSKQNIEQTDLNTDKTFKFEQKLFQASGSASFSKYDSHYLSYLHTDNTGTDNVSIFNSQPFGTVNNVDQIELNDEFAFDSLRKYTFTSSVLNSVERGSIYYRRLYAREDLRIKLPKNLMFNANYNLGLSKLDSNKVQYQGIQTSLAHQLFESLNSKIFYEHNETDQITYNDARNKYGCDFRYVKKIPTGKLTLSYSYFREYQNVKTAPTTISIVREEKTLVDLQITYLNNSNVNLSSVVVRDVTGAIVYHLTLDYLLVETNGFVEIIRVPGGLIPNGTTVFVDYTSNQAGKYGYYMDNYNFNADLLLFGNKLDLYYRSNSQNYSVLQRAENLSLNYYNRNVLGARIDLYFAKAGMEYEYYYSTILPYEALNYFLEMQHSVKKFSFNMSAHLQTIKMTSEQGSRQDIDVSAKASYYMFKKTRLDVDYMYRNIQGRGINLELTTGRVEITTEMHRLMLSLGGEFYINQEVNSRLKFKGVYVQITRNF